MYVRYAYVCVCVRVRMWKTERDMEKDSFCHFIILVWILFFIQHSFHFDICSLGVLFLPSSSSTMSPSIDPFIRAIAVAPNTPRTRTPRNAMTSSAFLYPGFVVPLGSVKTHLNLLSLPFHPCPILHPWHRHRMQSATLQRHSAGNIDYDNLESYDNVPETQHLPPSQSNQHHDHHNNNFRTRSKTVSDAMGEWGTTSNNTSVAGFREWEER